MSETIKNVEPRFCFVCGTKLEEVELGWMQCKSEKCGEVFFPFKDIDGNQNLMLQNTPFTPNEQKEDAAKRNEIDQWEDQREAMFNAWERNQPQQKDHSDFECRNCGKNDFNSIEAINYHLKYCTKIELLENQPQQKKK